ncbi:DUF29 family protein [Acerihabitans sp.]|uniref:DUF29 family protein n=1 Tax=Acerihabitans sp. TaxID=2811394 RepID=UPI002ED9ACC3
MKWQLQAERQGRSWRLAIEAPRRKIERRLKKPQPQTSSSENYRRCLRRCGDQRGA